MMLNKIFAENLVTGKASKLYGLAEMVPEGRIMEAVRYLDEKILPGVEKKTGADSGDYVVMKTILQTMLYALQLRTQLDRLCVRYAHLKEVSEFYQKKNVFYLQELEKYTTAEALLSKETLEVYRAAALEQHKTHVVEVLKKHFPDNKTV